METASAGKGKTKFEHQSRRGSGNERKRSFQNAAKCIVKYLDALLLSTEVAEQYPYAYERCETVRSFIKGGVIVHVRNSKHELRRLREIKHKVLQAGNFYFQDFKASARDCLYEVERDKSWFNLLASTKKRMFCEWLMLGKSLRAKKIWLWMLIQ